MTVTFGWVRSLPTVIGRVCGLSCQLCAPVIRMAYVIELRSLVTLRADNTDLVTSVFGYIRKESIVTLKKLGD